MFSLSLEEFLMVLEHYNLSIWPLQLFAYLGVFAIMVLAINRFKYSNQAILAMGLRGRGKSAARAFLVRTGRVGGTGP